METEAASGQTIVLSSGNILAKTIAWRKGGDAASEVYESLHTCLEGPVKTVQIGNIYEFVGDDVRENNEVVDRQDLKISLKIFLSSAERSDLVDAIEKGLKLTNADTLDSVVITFSGHSEGTPISLDMAKYTWLVLEEMVAYGKVNVIGLSDVDTQLFIQLHQWAHVKPGIIQINLASCCVVPPELSEFCKKEGIQLLTHSDPINALSPENLDLLLVQTLSSLEDLKKDNSGGHGQWDLKWVLRYQVHLKCRGVLALKGYCAAIQQSFK